MKNFCYIPFLCGISTVCILKTESWFYDRWRGINPQANGSVRKNIHAAKKEDSLPVPGDDN